MPMHIGEAVITACVATGQLFMVDAEEVQDGGLEVVNMNGGADDAAAEVVAGASLLVQSSPPGSRSYRKRLGTLW